MARLARLVVPRQLHHVIQRGHNLEPVFFDVDDYRAFLQWLREAARQFGVAIHAYVLMPNHVHMLATPSTADGLAKMMQWLGRYYVPYFNRKYGRTGTLWQGRFRATVIDADTYFFAGCRYVESNPVRAGLVTEPGQYAWSSYGHHAGLKSDPLITDHALFWALGNTPFEREAAYKNLFEQVLAPAEMRKLQAATDKAWALGPAAFLQMIEQQAARRVQPAKKGRPSKTTGAVSPIEEVEAVQANQAAARNL